MRRLAWVVTALTLVGCATSTSPRSYPLPTAKANPGVATLCEGVRVSSLILHGELRAEGSVRTWVVQGTDTLSVDWPSDFVARFSPALVVLDAAGTVRAQEGDNIAATPTVGDFWHGLDLCIGGGDGVLVFDRGWPPGSPTT